jgi:thiol-disulfide isomerase/thioredoxin
MTTKTTTKSRQTPASRTWLWIGAGVLGLGLIVWMAMSIAGEEPVDASVGYGEVTIEGSGLPTVSNPNAGDPARGLVAPTVSGSDWDGNPVTIGPDGRSKIVVLLAHWCSHCQVEVPVIREWADAGGLPADVDLYGVTVLTDPLRAEFPPQDWLESENWDFPTIMDSEIGEAGLAYGLSGTPYYLVLDGENQNLGRFSGEIGVAGLNALVEIAQAGLGATAPAP